MKQFIELPKSKLIVNINDIKFVKLKYGELNKWEIISFNHTAMGTNNPVIEKEDFDYLYDVLFYPLN